MMGVIFKVKYNHFGDAHAVILAAIAKIIGSVADIIASDMQANAPVDTGSEAHGFYVNHDGQSGYDQAAGRAQSANATVHLLAPAPMPQDPYHAIISHAPEHTVYQELGTVHMPPQPAMMPAIDRSRQFFLEALVGGVNDAINGLR